MPAFPEPSETFIVSKARGLLRRGFDIQIVTFRRNAHLDQLFGGLGEFTDRITVVPSLRHGPNRALGFGRWASVISHHRARSTGRYLAGMSRPFRSSMLSAPLFDGAVAALSPDIVHFEFGHIAAGRCAVGLLAGCPVTVSFRGFDICLWRIHDKRAYDSVWREVHAIHTLGSDLAARVAERGCPARVPVSLIPPAIDTDFWRREGGAPREAGRPGRVRILSVGRLVPKKAYPDALAAVALLADRLRRQRGPVPEYRIAGDGPLRAELEASVDRLGLGPIVTFLGHLDRTSLHREYCEADLLLHTASSEGFGNSVIEAQAMGVAVVCTDAEGLRENVDADVTGLVVPRGDVERLAHALGRLVSDSGLRDAMGAAGVERARTLFTMTAHLDRWENFYLDVTAAGSLGGVARSRAE